MKNKYLYLLLSTLATVWSCRKDVEEFRPYTPTQEDLSQLFWQVPDASSHTVFPFGGSIPDTTLTTASGVRVFLADTENLFADDAGTPVPCSTCPDLKIEINTVLDKGDMISRGVLTTEHPDARILESAGIVEVRVTCNGQALELLPDRYIKVQIPADEVKNNMEVFTGSLDVSQQWAGWTSTGTEAFWAEWLLPGNGAQQSGYELILDRLGWNSCARPLPGSSSSFCVQLPEQFTALNARVYLVFENLPAVVELKGTDNSSAFCYPEAPVGYPIRVVTIGKTGGQYWLSSTFTEIGTNVDMSQTPHPVEENNLLNFLTKL
ncbi:MAG: hypothetical protein EP344_03900 [Bacteroidetes bacterium]|nr:MAG: hypothetical protein EP344_03900 [Bacteroidota bacterium]